MERGTAVGVIVREARALGISLPSRQVQALRAPDKSLALVNQWIAGARDPEMFQPEVYLSWLRALLAGQRLPHLPGASRLTEISGHVSGTEPGPERELLIDALLTTRARKRQRAMIGQSRYPADPTRRRDLRQAHRLLDALIAAPATQSAIDDLDVLTRIQSLAQALAHQAEQRLDELALHDHHQDQDPT